VFDRPHRQKLCSIRLLALSIMGLTLTFAPDMAHAKVSGLIVETVPAIEGIHIRVGDDRFVTDENGRVKIPRVAPKATVRVDEDSLVGDSQRVRFVAWSDGILDAERTVNLGESPRLQVGFRVDFLVKERFRTSEGEVLDAQTIDSFTIVDDTNTSTTFRGPSKGLAGPTALLWERFPAGTRWLPGIRIVRGDDALETENVSYTVASVTVEGESVPVSPDRFAPAVDTNWMITVDPSGTPIREVALAGAMMLLLLGGFFILMRVRRRRNEATAGGPSSLRNFVREKVARNRPRWVYVRVKLTNGRTVEGWTMDVRSNNDSEAVNIHVVHVSGPDGKQVASTPLDAFVLSSRIVDLEMHEDRPPVPT
jgi:hypothetical protein